ncbi:MAG: hypothetical protein HDQ90_02315 [Desulfovibrio sp.]|nr:hypothetical protein [Desulfovibrio sp.]
MNTRKIREDLGRIRTCVQRREYPRAVFLLTTALRELGGQTAPTDLRGDYRTAIADICADPAYKKEYSQPVAYQPGKERELLAFFNKFYKQVMGQEEEEDYEATLQRKLQIDRCISDGKAFLAEHKVHEAEECFIEAFRHYKNEFAAYGMVARALLDAGEYVRALGHVKKGLTEQPDDAELRRIAEECLRLRAQAGR